MINKIHKVNSFVERVLDGNNDEGRNHIEPFQIFLNGKLKQLISLGVVVKQHLITLVEFTDQHKWVVERREVVINDSFLLDICFFKVTEPLLILFLFYQSWHFNIISKDWHADNIVYFLSVRKIYIWLDVTKSSQHLWVHARQQVLNFYFSEVLFQRCYGQYP